MSDNAAMLANLLRQLDTTEWLSRDALEALQFRQLVALAKHCAAHSPHFRTRLYDAGLIPDDLERPGALQNLPLLRRRDLQAAKDLFCDAVPDGHAPTFETRTSGSTGEPVTVLRTAVNQMDWLAITMREHLWHKRAFGKPICVIRANISEPVLAPDWGAPVNLLFKSAPLLGLPITLDLDAQIARLIEFKPHTLIVYPSNLAGLAQRCAERGIELPGLSQILTMGETLSPQTRQDAAQTFGAAISDMYSSQELGTIALQCPASGLYHVMAENLFLEFLHEDGTPCGEGETGRIVITDLRNFATPLVRYDIGDYGQVGPLCGCGRSLPTLQRILGRERNLVLKPDGTRHWPLVGFQSFRDLAPVIQYQFIQESRDGIEMRLVVERPLTQDEEGALRAHAQKALGHPFALRFTYFDGKIPAAPNGKFEEFVCRAA